MDVRIIPSEGLAFIIRNVIVVDNYITGTLAGVRYVIHQSQCQTEIIGG